ncbi:hypothetical protein [Alishewanella phage vB_AspM_Slicko01]|nr:hypothetical protein [Alishewanella phage vB_AspM_Slicko01]
MALTDLGKLTYHNGGDIEPATVAVHSAAPSADGLSNRIQAPAAATFDLAVIGDPEYRYLSADVEFTLTAPTQFTHFSVYNAAGDCLHIVAVDTPRSLETNDKIVLRGDTAPKMGIRITSTV